MTTPSYDVLANILILKTYWRFSLTSTAESDARAEHLYTQRKQMLPDRKFPVLAAWPPFDRFTQDGISDQAPFLASDTMLWSGTARQTVMNRMEHLPEDQDIVARRLDAVSDHLILLDSLLGAQDEHPGIPRGVYDLEPDYFYPERTFSALGRYMLCEILRPSREVRIVTDVTATLNADGSNDLPNADVIGIKRVSMHALGRGSARLVSDPVVPRRIGGHWYILIDLGRNGRHFPEPRPGLMALYGLDVPLDNRVVTVFGRNISALSEKTFRTTPAPSWIRDVRTALSNDGLFYSGIYEDGWVGERSMFRLRKPRAGSAFIMRGEVPNLTGVARNLGVNVQVDGGIAHRSTLAAGRFTLHVPTSSRVGVHTVRIEFTSSAHLPGVDDRPVSARLIEFGFDG